MIQLRSQVYAADQQNGDVNKALLNLRSYVLSHMNTNLASGPNAVYPPIQLKYTYQRLLASAQEQTAAANAQVYTDAQHYCEQQNSSSFSGRTRVPCVENYVQQHGLQTKAIPAALYEFSFVSPTWSPDLAGWSLLASVVLLFITIVSLAGRQWLKFNS